MAALPRRIIKETQRLMQEPVPGEERQSQGKLDLNIFVCFRNQRHSRWEQRQIFPCDRDRSWRLALRRGPLQARAVFARGLSNVSSEGSLHHEDLPSEHRQTRKNLLGHSKRQMEPGTSNSHRLALDTSLIKCPQSRRSTRQRCRRVVESERGWSNTKCQRMDSAIRNGR